MDRERAIERYQEETAERIRQYRDQMGQHLLEEAEQMEEMIKGAMIQL